MRERMFTNSVQGICYLLLLICSPIASIMLQLVLKDSGLSLYTTMFVNGLVIAYEYIGLYGENRVISRLWWERLIGIFAIAIMAGVSFIMLLYRIMDEQKYTYGCIEYVLFGIWIVPCTIAVKELIIILRYEYVIQTSPDGGIGEYISKHACKV